MTLPLSESAYQAAVELAVCVAENGCVLIGPDAAADLFARALIQADSERRTPGSIEKCPVCYRTASIPAPCPDEIKGCPLRRGNAE